MLAFNGGAARRAAELSRYESAAVTVVDGRIVAADGATCRLLGASAVQQVVGRPLADFVAPGAEDLPPAEARPELATVVRLDGELLVSEWSVRPSRWKGRTATRFTLWPVNGDPRRIERLAAGDAPSPAHAVITADICFGIRSFSSRAEELYGWREPDVLYRSLTDVVGVGDDADGFHAVLPELRRSGSWQGRALQRCSGGGRFPALLTATVVRDGGGRDLGTVWLVTSEAGSPA